MMAQELNILAVSTAGSIYLFESAYDVPFLLEHATLKLDEDT